MKKSQQTNNHSNSEIFSSHFDTSYETKYGNLSESLLKRGELRLLHGDLSGIHYFDMAIKLDPSNALLFYQQGLALFEYGSDEGGEKELRLASKRFKVATQLAPQFFEAWHAWGNTLFFLGKKTKKRDYFENAKNKFKKAISLSQGQPSDVLAELHWDYAEVWNRIAKYSLEATDLHISLKSFEKATSYQNDFPSEFWLQFGQVAKFLGKKTNDLRFFLKAMHCFKNAISISISSVSGWLELGETLKLLYTYTHDEDHFSQANECYMTVAQLKPKNEELWLNWASLLLESGKASNDLKKLRSAIEKCHKAYKYHANTSQISAIWAESLAVLGVITDRLDFIHEAENKMVDLEKRGLQTPDILLHHGNCLLCLGKYFNDLDYYYQAAEKYQAGLSINRAKHQLWFALGTAYFYAARFEEDEKVYEIATKFYQRALNLHINSTYHYEYASLLTDYGEKTDSAEKLGQAIHHFNQALALQKNAPYLHPDWLFDYAVALNLHAEKTENETELIKALELLHHVLMVDPEFPKIHYQLALVYSRYGELIHETEYLHRSLHHFRIAHNRDKENDQIILDWAITLINIGEIYQNTGHADSFYKEAEYKMIQSAKLGNVYAFYHLGCLYALQNKQEKSLHFLEKAYTFEALPPLEELYEDDWLDNLKDAPAFREFLQMVELNSPSQREI